MYSGKDLNVLYPTMLYDVELNGDTVIPRGQEVKEVRPLILELTDPTKSMVHRPSVNRALMWMEIVHLFAGEYNEDLFRHVSPSAVNLMSSHGAYGPRVSLQLEGIISEIVKDPDTRRAFVMVSRESDLRKAHEGEKEIPCTISWQFFVRSGKLEMVVNMRSWDLVWGLSGDVPCFTAIQRAIAWALGLGLGTYYHVAGSGHIYERHYGIWGEVRKNRNSTLPDFIAEMSGDDPMDRWLRLVDSAMQTTRALRLRKLDTIPDNWKVAHAAWISKFK